MYHLSKNVQLSFNDAVQKVTEELKKEGFGIITNIDLKEAFKQKIGVEFRNYTILGACNPGYAHKSLSLNNKIGVFLPCNVVVQQHDNGEVEVSVVNPEEVMQTVGEPSLTTFAKEVKDAMQRVLSHL